ncbi:MAG: hypothetical protein OYG31_01720 [Candidatus Kaiserbacteria bacterium]|nr:hypothetical protein [Candidatus Kaiserbacteria bacterium]
MPFPLAKKHYIPSIVLLLAVSIITIHAEPILAPQLPSTPEPTGEVFYSPEPDPELDTEPDKKSERRRFHSDDARAERARQEELYVERYEELQRQLKEEEGLLYEQQEAIGTEVEIKVNDIRNINIVDMGRLNCWTGASSTHSVNALFGVIENQFVVLLGRKVKNRHRLNYDKCNITFGNTNSFDVGKTLYTGKDVTVHLLKGDDGLDKSRNMTVGRFLNAGNTSYRKVPFIKEELDHIRQKLKKLQEGTR